MSAGRIAAALFLLLLVAALVAFGPILLALAHNRRRDRR